MAFGMNAAAFDQLSRVAAQRCHDSRRDGGATVILRQPGADGIKRQRTVIGRYCDRADS